jgi:hypothetical protein
MIGSLSRIFFGVGSILAGMLIIAFGIFYSWNDYRPTPLMLSLIITILGLSIALDGFWGLFPSLKQKSILYVEKWRSVSLIVRYKELRAIIYSILFLIFCVLGFIWPMDDPPDNKELYLIIVRFAAVVLFGFFAWNIRKEYQSYRGRRLC